AQPPPPQIFAASEGVEQPDPARGREAERHRVDREVAPREVFGDRRGPDGWKSARTCIGLSSSRREVQSVSGRSDSRRSKPAMDPDGSAQLLRDLPSQRYGIPLDGEIQIAYRLPEEQIPHRSPHEIERDSGSTCDSPRQLETFPQGGRQPRRRSPFAFRLPPFSPHYS